MPLIPKRKNNDRKRSSPSRSPAVARARRSRTAYSRSSGAPKSSSTASAPADRRGRHHHRRVGRELHRARVRALRRPALLRVRATVPQAQRARRPRRAYPQSGQLAEDHRRQRRALGARRGVLRRDSLRRRDLRRPARQARAAELVSGTDISTGSRLAFNQTDFDLLCFGCSNKVHLSRAAATSSAVPVVLSAVTFNNYGGTCEYEYPAWVKDVANPESRARPAARAYRDTARCRNSRTATSGRTFISSTAVSRTTSGCAECWKARRARGKRRVPRPVGFGARRDRDHRRQFPLGAAHRLGQERGAPRLRRPAPAVLQRAHRSLLVRIRRADEGPPGNPWQEAGTAVARARLKGETEAEAEASVPFPKLSLHAIDVSFD